METLKLSAEEIRYIAVFESMTGAVVKDCICDEQENKILFIVKKGDMGLAIGRKGSHIQKVKQTLGKKIEVLEYSEDAVEFMRNVFHPYRVKNVSLTANGSKKVALVSIDDRDKSQAIGRGGSNIKKVKMLAARHHGIDEVIVT